MKENILKSGRAKRRFLLWRAFGKDGNFLKERFPHYFFQMVNSMGIVKVCKGKEMALSSSEEM